MRRTAGGHLLELHDFGTWERFRHFFMIPFFFFDD